MKESNWTPCNQLPPNETIKIFFHGLLSFSNYVGNDEKENRCEIGVHNSSESHTLQISIYDLTLPYNDPYCYRPTNVKTIKDSVFTLEIPGMPPSVSYFQPNGFNRQENQGDERDFRWIVDLESSEFYNQELVKIPEIIKPRFHIKNGIFYTLYKSKSKYKKVISGQDNGVELGSIAYYIGANIYLDADHPAILKIDKEILFEPSKRYIIGITNNCEQATPMLNAQGVRMENDFGEYYKTFNLPEGKDKYDLVYTDAQEEGFDVNQIISPSEVRCNKRANDATPCGALGYGKGNGLP